LGLLDLECPSLQIIEQKQGYNFKKLPYFSCSQNYLDVYVAIVGIAPKGGKTLAWVFALLSFFGHL
jgi:hypothetical protein